MVKGQTKHQSSEDQQISNLFGQTAVFALDDASVDPKVIDYLRDVRTEALRTIATSQTTYAASQRPASVVRHSASMYDDDGGDVGSGDATVTDNCSEIALGEHQRSSTYGMDYLRTVQHASSGSANAAVITPPANISRERANSYIKWFGCVRKRILDKAIATQEYDDRTINLLLFYLREYLEVHYTVKKGVVAHLVNLLRDSGIQQEEHEESWALDESWVAPTLKRLGSVRLRTIEDVKICLRGDYTSYRKTLSGFREWSRFIREDEPLHSMFCTLLKTADDLCLLLNFFSQTWLQWILKEDNTSKHLVMWLFYILVHLPSKLAATHISALRELAKKCLTLLEAGTVVPLYPTTEMKLQNTEAVPENLGLLQLVVVLVSVKYGQLDLLGYE